MKPRILERKYPFLLGILFLSVVVAFGFLYFGSESSGVVHFPDRMEYRGLSRIEAEKRGILGLPKGISDYYFKKCSFKTSWLVYSKYTIGRSGQREELLERFRRNSGLNRRFDSYPVEWPEKFDLDSCRPDWWNPCPKGEWAEIRRESNRKGLKDGFYVCESGSELRWFVFHFKEVQ